MTFAQRRNRLTMHFSERVPVVERRMTVQMHVTVNNQSALQITGLTVTTGAVRHAAKHIRLSYTQL